MPPAGVSSAGSSGPLTECLLGRQRGSRLPPSTDGLARLWPCAILEKAIAYHREAYRITRAAYDEQLATFDRVVDEHAALTSAAFDVYGAHYQARLAEARLRQLTAER